MITNYLKLAFRHLIRNKGYSGLTMFGLAVGVASFLMIALWVIDELNYDRFHYNGDRIYRALWDGKVGDNEWQIPLAPVPLAEALKEFPEIEQTVRFVLARRWIRHQGTLLQEKNFVYTEPSFLTIFTVQFLSGDPATALTSPGKVVVTRTAALRYFGTEDAVGYRLELSDGSLFHVSGVVEAFPPQSHFHFEILAPIENYPRFQERQTQWGSATVYTYLLLKENAPIASLDIKMKTYVKQNILDKEALFASGQNRTGFIFQRLHEIHLHSDFEYELEPPGNVKTVYLLGAVGVFILILACINFVNLSTARATQRAREVGVRKAVGSDRTQLVKQFFMESSVFVLLAMSAGILIVEIAIPQLNGLTGKDLVLRYADPVLVGSLAALAVLVTILAGMYPALVLSSFTPDRVLKGQISENSSRSRLRNVLVVFQFCICIGLMIGMVVVQGQLKFMLEKQLGFDREHVLVIRDASALGSKRDAFVRELESSSGVVAASVAQTLPGYEFDSNLFEPEQPSNYKQTSLTYAMVDHKFLDALRIKVVEGRNFSRDMPTDSSALLMNRAAAAALGWTRPLGRKLRSGDMEWQVIGVVEDFHFESLRSEIKPIVFPFLRWTPQFIAVRLQAGDISGHVAFIAGTWKKFVPDRPLDYSFLDQDYERLYRNEQRLSRIFAVFTSIALVIACLGLFGLAAYAVQQRTKEIGIRKVLGASVAGIVGLLSQQFLRLVALAGIIACPVAYYAVQQWLEGFAYRVQIGPFVFLGVAMVALLIALLTVTFQAIKAALTNPVEALRYE